MRATIFVIRARKGMTHSPRTRQKSKSVHLLFREGLALTQGETYV